MAALDRRMLKTSVEAYLEYHAEKALENIKLEEEVDKLHLQIYHDLIDLMLASPANVNRATQLLMISSHFENIADRVGGICNRVVFMVTGEVGKAQLIPPLADT